jgi:hypothetical protein
MESGKRREINIREEPTSRKKFKIKLWRKKRRTKKARLRKRGPYRKAHADW